MMQNQISTSDPEIGLLRGRIAEMGGLAEEAIARAMLALQRGDEVLANAVRRDDARIDALQVDAEAMAVRIIGRGALSDRGLRDVVAALKIAGVLERIGDYAKNIAKRVPQITTGDMDARLEPISILPAMARLARELVHDALDAFAARDVAAAVDVCEHDRALDDFYDSIFRTLVTHMVENPNTVGQVAHLLFVAKHLERIGDHATNVAEMVYYAAAGTPMDDRVRGRAA